MPGAASERSSSDLRQEMAALDVRLSELDGKSSDQDAKIRALALAVVRNDPTAPGRVAQCRERKAKIAEEVGLLQDAKVSLTGELEEALAREERERLCAAADEQERIAAEVEPLGQACDDALRDFKAAYAKLKRVAHLAGPHGDGREMQIRAACAQAFAWALYDLHEFRVDPPAPLEGRATRPTFSYYSRSWAAGARGTAARLRAPPVVRKPNGRDAAIADALRLNGKQPYRVDVGEAMPGDPPEFRVYDPGEVRQ